MTEDAQLLVNRHEQTSNVDMPPALLAQLDGLKTFAADASRTAFYETHEEEEFWFEMLAKQGLHEMIREIVDAWTEDDHNLGQAAQHVGRPLNQRGPAVIKKYGYCRFKASSKTDWKFLEGGPRVDNEQQTIVFIALDDLGTHNGFPAHVSKGQAAFLDGRTSIMTPPSGGGEAVFLSLRI